MNKNYYLHFNLIIFFLISIKTFAQYKPEMITVKGGSFEMGTKKNPYIETN